MAEKKDIDYFKDRINKHFGKHSGVLVENLKEIKIEKIPTGSYKLNKELNGGIPKGKITELFGGEQSSKTTQCLHIVAEHQKKYPEEPVYWLDLEGVFDPDYCENIGVDLDPERFVLGSPSTGEDSYYTIIEFAKAAKEGGLVVIDSSTVLLPEKEDSGDMGDAQMGSQARLNSQGLRKLIPHTKKNNVTAVFISQTRSKIGGYGDPTTTPGGKALSFYSRTRLQLYKSKGEEGFSNTCKIKTVKATYGNENKTVVTQIIFKEGVDKIGEIIDIAVEKNIIDKSGSWFSYDGTKIGQGKAQVRDILKDNPELYDRIVKNIEEHE